MSFDIRQAKKALKNFIDILRENGFDLIIWDQGIARDRKIAGVMSSLHYDKIIIVAESTPEERYQWEMEGRRG